MDIFLPNLVNGIAYGLILFLIASGMTLTMGLLRVVNMSHGAIFMFSAYFGVFIYNIITVNGSGGAWGVWAWIISILAACIMGGLLGLGIEVGFLRPLYASPMSQVLLTIGLINILTNSSLWLFGGQGIATPVPAFLRDVGFNVGSARIPLLKIFIIVFGLIMAFALWWMQDKTSIGAKVRAGMDNGTIAGTMGLNKKSLFSFVFILGSAIAGLSSIIGGSVVTIDQNTGWNVLLQSIIVVVIGGAGSIPGALIGGLILGIVNTMCAAYLQGVSSFALYLVLIIVLVIRPQGLMGRKADIDKASDDYSSMKAIEKPLFTVSRLGKMTPALQTKVNTYKVVPYIFFLVLAVVLPLVTSSSTQNILSLVLIYALFAASLDIVMGYTGNRSFGHAAYFGMGAYIVALLNMHLQISSFWLILIITIVVCGILAMIIGYLTLKLTGTNFLLVTMAFGQLLTELAKYFKQFTEGTDGITVLNFPNFGFANSHNTFWNAWWQADGKLNLRIYFFILIIVVICFLIMHRFMRASFGSSLKGVKGNEGRMRALGFHTWQLRYVAVIIAGIFAGIAGMLYAWRIKSFTPNVFAISTSAMPMLMVIIGGGSTLWGPMIGAALIVLVQNYAGILFPNRWQLLLGLIYVICVMFLRNGFAPSLQKFWNWVGYKIFKKDFVDEEPKKSIKEEAAI